MNLIEIVNGNHSPAGHAYVAVDHFGMLVDLSEVAGQIYDPPTTARVVFGLKDLEGRRFGRVTLKNGQSRTFFDAALMTPYLNAFYREYERRGHGEAAPFLARERPTQNL